LGFWDFYHGTNLGAGLLAQGSVDWLNLAELEVQV